MIAMVSTSIRIAVAMAAVFALLASHQFAYQAGQDSILGQWHKAKAEDASAWAAAEVRARERERQIAFQLRTAEDRHAQEVTRRAADASGARHELERLRTQITSSSLPTCGAAQAASATRGADAPTTFPELFSQCSIALSDLAAEADRLAGQVSGLQNYLHATQEPSP